MVGKVGRAHGVRGDVVLDVRTDEPERRFVPGTSFATARGELTIAVTRWHGQRLLARFEQVSDRTGAERVRGVELRAVVAADERPEDPEEFYDHQLLGLTAVTSSGEHLGPVREVLHLPAQDVLVVNVAGNDVLVPFVTQLVPTVDLATGRVVVVDRPGLIDGDEASPSAAIVAEGSDPSRRPVEG